MAVEILPGSDVGDDDPSGLFMSEHDIPDLLAK